MLLLSLHQRTLLKTICKLEKDIENRKKEEEARSIEKDVELEKLLQKIAGLEEELEKQNKEEEARSIQ